MYWVIFADGSVFESALSTLGYAQQRADVAAETFGEEAHVQDRDGETVYTATPDAVPCS